MEVFTGADGIVRSARVKISHGELKIPVVKLAPVFYDGVSEIGNRAGNVGATDTQIDIYTLNERTTALHV